MVRYIAILFILWQLKKIKREKRLLTNNFSLPSLYAVTSSCAYTELLKLFAKQFERLLEWLEYEQYLRDRACIFAGICNGKSRKIMISKVIAEENSSIEKISFYIVGFLSVVLSGFSPVFK